MFWKMIIRTLPVITLLLFGVIPVTAGTRAVAGEDVYLRKEGNGDAEVIRTIYGGTVLEIIEENVGKDNDWDKVAVNGLEGYIGNRYLRMEGEEGPGGTDEKSGVVEKENPVNTATEEEGPVISRDGNTFTYREIILKPDLSGQGTHITDDGVLLRANASESSAVLRSFEKYERITVKGDPEDGWTYVQADNGLKGYVKTEYVSTAPEKNPVLDKQQGTYVPGEAGSIKEKAVEYAKTRIGDIYSQSRRDQEGYADCSSLVRDAYEHASGICIGNTTDSQRTTMDGYFYAINSIDDAEAGDLVYHFSGANHAGICLGDGQVLHASCSRGKVLISDFSGSGYWEYGCRADDFCTAGMQ